MATCPAKNNNQIMISVAVVEDNLGFRRSLELLLAESPGFRCVCACGSGEEALRILPRCTPDVVLMDIHLPNISGIECTAQIKQLMPKVLVVMITVYNETDKIFQALRAGASGYLLKRSSPEDILHAISDVMNGGAPMTQEIARQVVGFFKAVGSEPKEKVQLGRRKDEILSLLSQGYANKEIAQTLSISLDTVRTHLRQIYELLHVRSRTEAVARFIAEREREHESTAKHSIHR
jgi:DNA-binding NarL/FixJ family response regulator